MEFYCYIALLFVEIEQLQDVLQELPDFTEWEKLGLNLGLRQGKLNVIEEDCRRNANRLSKVIQEWLRRNHNEKQYGRPTWSNLVKAIKPIENALALEIEKKHCAVRGKPYLFHEHTHTHIHTNTKKAFEPVCIAFYLFEMIS